MAESLSSVAVAGKRSSQPHKLHGRAFYESIGSPRVVVAPMVDRSEFAWRMLTRSYMDEESKKSLLAYTPMMHARLFQSGPKFRDGYFQPTRASLTSKERSTAPAYLDGHPAIDRPLFVQFCANKPEELLEAAKYVAPYCDAVDLNLGCPQGIAKSGNYGAFLQEDWDTIYKLINCLHQELPVPVTAKMRVLETREKTLDYAKMLLSAGASIITVHGRRREQKGQNTGIADWPMIRYLRDNLPPETVIFANGNILNRGDVQTCLEATGVDGIMSAEGNLSDPTIFAKPPAIGLDNREYWRGSNGQEGYRIDGVVRRYLDIIHKYVLERSPPIRRPLYVPGDPPSPPASLTPSSIPDEDDERPRKRRKRDESGKKNSPNLRPMQGHLFQLFRPFVAAQIQIRDALGRCRVGDIDAFERVLTMLEEAVKKALQEEAQKSPDNPVRAPVNEPDGELDGAVVSSERTIAKYKRPWWICQPHIRQLPEEAIKNGSLKMSKKERAKRELDEKNEREKTTIEPIAYSDENTQLSSQSKNEQPELPEDALVCG